MQMFQWGSKFAYLKIRKQNNPHVHDDGTDR